MKPWEKYQPTEQAAQKPWQVDRSIPINEQIDPSRRGFDTPREESTFGGRVLTGMADPIFGASQFIENTLLPTGVVEGLDTANKWLLENTGGILGREQNINPYLKEREQQYQAELPKDEGFDEARLLGNIATGLVGAKGMGAPTTMGKALGLGAAEGGVLGAAAPVVSDDYWGDKSKQIGVGALGGAAGGAVGQGISRLIAPNASSNTAARELMEEGIDLTPGQLSGGMSNTIEQKASSVPFLGGYIDEGREKAQNQFNKAVLNRAVKSIGGKVNNIGHEGVGEAQTLVNAAYKDAEEFAPSFRIDDITKESIRELGDFVKYLPESETKRYAKFFNDKIKKRFDSGGNITSKTYKQMASELRKQAGNANIEQETAGGAFKQLEEIFRENAKRINPDYAKKLKNADKAFAQLRTIEKAASNKSANEGVFTPSNIIQSSKAADKSKGKNLSARGGHDLQKFATKAHKIMGDTVADSGTAGRNALVGTLGAGLVDPVSAATGTAALYASSQAYRPAMQKVISKMMVSRPEEAARLAKELGIAMPVVGSNLEQDRQLK